MLSYHDITAHSYSGKQPATFKRPPGISSAIMLSPIWLTISLFIQVALMTGTDANGKYISLPWQQSIAIIFWKRRDCKGNIPQKVVFSCLISSCFGCYYRCYIIRSNDLNIYSRYTHVYWESRMIALPNFWTYTQPFPQNRISQSVIFAAHLHYVQVEFTIKGYGFTKFCSCRV